MWITQALDSCSELEKVTARKSQRWNRSNNGLSLDTQHHKGHQKPSTPSFGSSSGLAVALKAISHRLELSSWHSVTRGIESGLLQLENRFTINAGSQFLRCCQCWHCRPQASLKPATIQGQRLLKPRQNLMTHTTCLEFGRYAKSRYSMDLASRPLL